MTRPRLPIAVKVRSSTHFAEGVDEPVEHIPSDPAWIPLVPLDGSAKRKASPALLTFALPTDVAPLALTLTDCRLDSDNPIARFIAWAIEREAIRRRRGADQPPPWTTDPILRDNRFCNTYREYDGTTVWITNNIVQPHRDDPDCWFAIAGSRIINEPTSLIEVLPCLLPFDPEQLRATLEAREARGETIWRGAYRSAMAKKGESRIARLIEIITPLWADRESLRWRPDDTLGSFTHRLRRYDGLGPFLAAQIAADLKHLEAVKSASDWWTFALPGDGSKRGLNRVRGRSVDASWSEQHWYNEHAKLYVETASLFTAAGLGPLDAQNLQNCECEFDKWERLRDGGKSTRPFKLGQPDAAPAPKRPKKTKTKTKPAAPLQAESIAASPLPVAPDDWSIIERGGNDLLDAGLRAAARGWTIFPCNAEKKPLGKWRAIATTDPTTITTWSRQPRVAMWGRALPAGVLLIDLDCKHEGKNGVLAFQQLQGCVPDQFNAPRVITGSGGIHIYTDPTGRDFKNSASVIAAGIDTKTLGGYCIIPSGDGLYRWLTDPDTPMPAAPMWAEKVLRQPEKPEPAVAAKPYQGYSPLGDAVLERACKAIREAPLGVRRDTFNHRSLIVGHYVGGGLLKYEDACEQLMAAAREQGGWDDTELEKWVARAVKDGMREPQDGDDDARKMQEINRLYAENPQLHEDVIAFLRQQSQNEQQQDQEPQPEQASAQSEEGDAHQSADGAGADAKADTNAFTGIPLTTQEWLTRNLPEPDLLLGHVISTTTRAIMHADTGLGKTNFWMAAFGHIAAGKSFLHWSCPRPRRVLYIDGEMSRRLFRDRIADVGRRLGEPPPGMYFFNKEDMPDFAPLNTRDGQVAVWALINEVERRSGQKLDAICFDSIMALLLGDMKEEDAWRDTLPFVKALTARYIGQLWVHHTGHDASRGYGTKTREWQLDTVLHGDALEDKPPDIDVAFRLSFQKSRERTPANRLDFTDATISLTNDRWTGVMLSNARGKINESLTHKFYEALCAAVETSRVAPTGTYPTASLDEWRAQCTAWGLLDPGKAHSGRTLFARHKLKLIATNWIACSEELAWALP